MKQSYLQDEEIRIIGGKGWIKNTSEQSSTLKRQYPYPYIIGGIIVCIVLTAIIGFYIYRHHSYRFSYPVSRSEEDVIEQLETPTVPLSPGVFYAKDSLLGVPLHIYRLQGLSAEFAEGVPSLDDPDIYLITRNADYRYENDEKVIIGDYIENGITLSENHWRAGYFISVGDHFDIGVGRHPDIKEYAIKKQGNMFRQFALVSAGIKCISQYELKGKVTRCAYARKAGNQFYFIETVNPETLYGFADALIEYGFVDAIYVTGGAQPSLFYRDEEGNAHGTYVDDKPHRMVVWKKRNSF